MYELINTKLLLMASANFASVMNKFLTFTERFDNAVRMFFIVMGCVFFALIILKLILNLFKMFSPASKQKKEKAEPTFGIKSQEKIDSSPKAAQENDDAEIIAAITAAISAFNDEANQGNLSFRVVSFKRRNKVVAWNLSENN